LTAAIPVDRLHQAMLLFAAGQGEALSAFCRSRGRTRAFGAWPKLSQHSYPTGSEERRWVEGVLARKKSLGI